MKKFIVDEGFWKIFPEVINKQIINIHTKETMIQE